MSDLISREAVIAALTDTLQYEGMVMDELISVVANIPAADVVERKKGKWLPMTVSSGRDSWKCSVCGRRARGKIENLPFCHCGADMRGEGHG